MTWAKTLKKKLDTFDAFKEFKALVEAEKKVKISCLRIDQGGEFNSIEFTNFCMNEGIKKHLTSLYSPQQNEVVERRNRTIMDMA